MDKSERHFTVPLFKQQRVPHQETQVHFHNMQHKQISKQYSHLRVKFAEPLEVMLGYAHHPQEYDRSNHEGCKIPFNENSDDRSLVKQFMAAYGTANWKEKLGHHLKAPLLYNVCLKKYQLAVKVDPRHKEAYFTLSVLFNRGLGIKRDLASVTAVWRKAAKFGHAAAQYNLGVLYAEDMCTYAAEQAAFWYQKAADQVCARAYQKLNQKLCLLQGYNKAQYNLGTMYRKGIGVEQVNVSVIRCL